MIYSLTELLQYADDPAMLRGITGIGFNAEEGTPQVERIPYEIIRDLPNLKNIDFHYTVVLKNISEVMELAKNKTLRQASVDMSSIKSRESMENKIYQYEDYLTLRKYQPKGDEDNIINLVFINARLRVEDIETCNQRGVKPFEFIVGGKIRITNDTLDLSNLRFESLNYVLSGINYKEFLHHYIGNLDDDYSIREYTGSYSALRKYPCLETILLTPSKYQGFTGIRQDITGFIKNGTLKKVELSVPAKSDLNSRFVGEEIINKLYPNSYPHITRMDIDIPKNYLEQFYMIFPNAPDPRRMYI